MAGSGTAQAQAYPNKPIRIIGGSAAGGPVDITARILAAQFTESGWPTVVENRTGAGGTIGAEYVAKSPPDGYTLLMVSAAALCIAPAIYPDLRYDPIKDFSPISTMVDSFAVLVVNPSIPVSNAKELIAYAKSRAATPLAFGSAGVGSHTHLAMELFKSMSGIPATHIPYKGGAPALLDVVAGRTDMMMIPVIGLGQFAKGNKLKLLGLTSGKHLDSLPDLPTIAESGLPGYQSSSWYGLIGPAGMQRDVVMKLHDSVVKILGTREMLDSLKGQGLDAVGNTPEQFAALIKSELPKWAKVVKESGAKLE